MNNSTNVIMLDTYRRPAVSFYRMGYGNPIQLNQAEIVCFYKARRERAGN